MRRGERGRQMLTDQQRNQQAVTINPVPGPAAGWLDKFKRSGLPQGKYVRRSFLHQNNSVAAQTEERGSSPGKVRLGKELAWWLILTSHFSW